MTSAASVPKLHIKNFIPPEGWYNIARHVRGPGHVSPEHTHDFPEVFWMERGIGIHFIHGQAKEMRAGDVILIRPPDRHAVGTPASARSEVVFSLVNFAFRLETLEYIRRRYYAGREAAFPWRGAELPARFRVGADDLRHLAELADSLARGPQTRLRLESFLLALLDMLERTVPHAPEAAVAMPDWLRGALPVFAQPKHFAGGVPELARLAGRGPEHLNRVVRRCLGETTTDLVNRLRLEYSARELSMSGRPILEIALDAGFDNLSYFYRLFNKRYGQTPRRYRLHSQMPVR